MIDPEEARAMRSLWRQVLIQMLIDDGPAELAKFTLSNWGHEVCEMAGLNPAWVRRKLLHAPRQAYPRSRQQLQTKVLSTVPLSAAQRTAARYRAQQREKRARAERV